MQTAAKRNARQPRGTEPAAAAPRAHPCPSPAFFTNDARRTTAWCTAAGAAAAALIGLRAVAVTSSVVAR